ncbi:MAG: hypothetical protein QXS00_07895 [Pyrobaculum sp.]
MVKPRGISTMPVVLALLTIAIAAFFFLLQWSWAQGKGAEKASVFAQRLAEEKYKCLTAVSSGGAVVVGGVQYSNYTGPGCYVDPSVVIVFDVYNGTK